MRIGGLDRNVDAYAGRVHEVFTHAHTTNIEHFSIDIFMFSEGTAASFRHFAKILYSQLVPLVVSDGSVEKAEKDAYVK